jgi:hypothetical protein
MLPMAGANVVHARKKNTACTATHNHSSRRISEIFMMIVLK